MIIQHLAHEPLDLVDEPSIPSQKGPAFLSRANRSDHISLTSPPACIVIPTAYDDANAPMRGRIAILPGVRCSDRTCIP
jgi:hypothetical protein